MFAVAAGIGRVLGGSGSGGGGGGGGGGAASPRRGRAAEGGEGAAAPGLGGSQVVLVYTGSFNPITQGHISTVKVARERVMAAYPGSTVRAVLSPCSSAYGKAGLLPGEVRLAMCELATADLPWVKVSGWELAQREWSRTVTVLAEVRRRHPSTTP